MGLTIPEIGGFQSWELQATTAILSIVWLLLLFFPIFIAKKNKQTNWMYLLILHSLIGFFLIPMEAGLIMPVTYLIFFQKKKS